MAPVKTDITIEIDDETKFCFQLKCFLHHPKCFIAKKKIPLQSECNVNKITRFFFFEMMILLRNYFGVNFSVKKKQLFSILSSKIVLNLNWNVIDLINFWNEKLSFPVLLFLPVENFYSRFCFHH